MAGIRRTSVLGTILAGACYRPRYRYLTVHSLMNWSTVTERNAEWQSWPTVSYGNKDSSRILVSQKNWERTHLCEVLFKATYFCLSPENLLNVKLNITDYFVCKSGFWEHSGSCWESICNCWINQHHWNVMHFIGTIDFASYTLEAIFVKIQIPLKRENLDWSGISRPAV